jgi:thiosulfate reductase cytochrome b subunit
MPEFSGIWLTLQKLHKKITAIEQLSVISPLYITYTFAERPKVENWHFSKMWGFSAQGLCYVLS